MTNDEGGTDDEEFRIAAVLDRIDTTMKVWMGLTAGCAQCHDHKFDPIEKREFYALAAFFDQSEDADRGDEAPTLSVPTELDLEAIAGARAELSAAREARREMLDRFPHQPNPEEAPPTPRESVELEPILSAGRTPPGADLRVNDAQQPWPWTEPSEKGSPTTPVVRIAVEKGRFSQVFFDRSYLRRDVAAADRLVAWAWLDPERPPTTVMLQVHCDGGGWEHRAVWGADEIGFGEARTPARRRLGDLPEPGRWTMLVVPIAEIGIEPGNRITGIALSEQGGNIEWAGVWHETPLPADLRFTRSLEAFIETMKADPNAPLPGELRAVIQKAEPTEEEFALLREHFLTAVHPEGRERFAPLNERVARAEREVVSIEGRAPRVPVMRELPAEKRRTSHVLKLGNFLMPEGEVAADVPAAFHDWPEGAPKNRLGLAAWLVSPDNPLTARVQVNRAWEQLFGRGLVETIEDLGTQGVLPSHPALLDHLALRFIEDGWRWKPLLRRIVLSETYRRSSTSVDEQRTLDPRNELLSWSPRPRLSAEVVRDQALAVSGILSAKMYGPPVFPAQPDGVWQVVYNGAQWQESSGEDRRRRALYTFWRRTSPYPSAMTFDAPSREVCSARRIRSSTPLQALVTLNDPVYLEAAAGLAARMLEARDRAGDLGSALAHGFRRATARHPDAEEHAILERVFLEQQRVYLGDPEAGAALLREGRQMIEDETPPESIADRAAFTVVAQVILNLDEVLVRR